MNKKYIITFIWFNKTHLFYPLPTIACWKNDFKDINFGVSYGASLNLFNWQTGVSLHINKFEKRF